MEEGCVLGCTALLEGADMVLTNDELALLVNHPEDNGLINRIKLMSKEKLAEFEHYRPKSLKHYNSLQMDWIETSRWLLGLKLGRKPNDVECMKDYLTQNHYRFRAFYVTKFPELVERMDGRTQYTQHAA
jgi:hypothetical protein